jgi:ribosome-dependent ATPase
VFSKALGFGELYSYFIPLLITIPVLLALCTALLKKQEA